MPDHRNLSAAFDQAMFELYRKTRAETDYVPSRFFQMLNDHGGVETARRLLPTMSEGYAALWERGRLDLTVEAIVVQPAWESLFTAAEVSTARDRLAESGYPTP